LVSTVDVSAPQPLERPFVRWLDMSQYTLLPGGSFEGGAPGWSLSGATVKAGNEPFFVRARADGRSLSLPPGSSATSAPLAVGLLHPTMRLLASASGGSALSTLEVDVLFELATGQVVSLPIGVVTAATNHSWAPSLPLPVVANLLPLLPGRLTPVAFRFTPRGNAAWTIDDVYVDPKRH
jgi:hypothetical protein